MVDMVRRPSGLYAPEDYMVPIAGGADFPLSDVSQRGEMVGANYTTTSGTTVTTSATVNTKGSWSQLIAATAADSWLAFISARNASAASLVFIDIGIGTAGSEVVVLPDIPFSNIDVSHSNAQVMLPLYIPAGSRVAACGQSSSAGAKNIALHMHLFHGTFQGVGGLSRWSALGANPASTSGVALPSPTANTKTAWVEVVSSCPHELKALVPIPFRNGSSSSSVMIRSWTDVGVGAAGSEVVALADAESLQQTNAQETVPLFSPWYPANIPAGSRVAVRFQVHSTTAVNPCDFILLGGG